MIAIIGAGLTGLSTAYHLREKPAAVFEQHDRLGGLCRSASIDGFTFDYTGHLLHLRNPRALRLLHTLLPGGLTHIVRRAAVYCRGRFLPYPFQANLCGLPREVALECVMGFIEACTAGRSPKSAKNFRDWVLATFGAGMSNYFFIPYNEKLWQCNLKKLTSDWAGWSIPRPTLQEVIQGALGIENRGMGYNASFYYPRKGGIQILPDALGERVKSVRLGAGVASVHLGKKVLTLDNGEECSYDCLVSTIPLPRLLSMARDLPAAYKKAGPRLSYVSVHNLNIGINRKRVSNYHWIYFPEPEIPFYRVGFYSNFTPHIAPAGTSSLYIEIAAPPASPKKHKALLEESVAALRQCGILKKGDRIVADQYQKIDCAYVLFDAFRRKHLPAITRYLKDRGVFCAGRYGEWTYSAMEDSLLQGRALAGELAC